MGVMGLGLVSGLSPSPPIQAAWHWQLCPSGFPMLDSAPREPGWVSAWAPGALQPLLWVLQLREAGPRLGGVGSGCILSWGLGSANGLPVEGLGSEQGSGTYRIHAPTQNPGIQDMPPHTYAAQHPGHMHPHTCTHRQPRHLGHACARTWKPGIPGAHTEPSHLGRAYACTQPRHPGHARTHVRVLTGPRRLGRHPSPLPPFSGGVGGWQGV